MDNINEFEDFDVEVVETSKSNTEDIHEEAVENEIPVENSDCAETKAEAESEIETETEVEIETETEAEIETEAEELSCNEDEVSQEIESNASNELIETLLEKIECLSAQNELLQNKFDVKIAQDEHKAQLFDKMYNELQSYKNDIYAKILKPFVMSTISLLDDTNSFIGKLGENESAIAEKYLRSVPDDLIDILESNGVVLYEDSSDKFNPRTQRNLKQVPTDNQELDGFIAKRVRKGYSWNGVNLKPELVWVYKFKQEENDK